MNIMTEVGSAKALNVTILEEGVLIQGCDPTTYMFVCLFVSSHLRIFHSYGDVTIASEGLQILTYARHLWPLISEGSLTCPTHCGTGLPFILVISEDP